MLHGREWRLKKFAWLLSAPLLACGITERNAQGRADGDDVGGATNVGAATSVGAATGMAGDSGARADAGGGGSATGGATGDSDDVTHGSGMELDPVDVGGGPAAPCGCGIGCAVERCEPVTLAMLNVFLMPKLGGAPRVIVSGERNPLVTASDSTSIYWVEQDLGWVRKVSN